jgi:aryl-alcohol dehydrogenase-like predicted oxidoreductase
MSERGDDINDTDDTVDTHETDDTIAAKRPRALAWLAENVDVTTEAGDRLRAFQGECDLSALEAAQLLWEAFDAQPNNAAPGAVCARLEAADSAGSFPYAAPYPYLADPSAPVVDCGTVTIGDVVVPRMGLGCMRLLSASGTVDGQGQTALGIPHSPEAVRHALLTAVDVCGIRYFDVARGYGPWPGFAERLLHEWLSPRGTGGPRGQHVLLASKVGYGREASGGWYVDLDAEFLAREVDACVAEFDGQVPLLYLVARSTPTTPVHNRPDDIARALKPLVDAQADGRVKHVGVANVTVDELAVFQSLAPIAAVQNRFTLHSLSDADERQTFERCAEHQIPFVAWGLFGEGALSQGLHPAVVVDVAAELGVTPEELTLATILSTGENVVALPGPGRRQTIYSSVKGASIHLDDDVRARLMRALG